MNAKFVYESINFNREENAFDKLKIGKKYIELKFEDLKVGENYLATILGSLPIEKDFKEKIHILDKDKDTILVCRLDQLNNVKYLAKKSKVKLTLDFILEIGVEDLELEEDIYDYYHVEDHIETVMGYRVKFNYLN